MSIKFSSIPQKRLLQGITSASTTFYLNNILSFDGLTDVAPADLGTQHYCAFRNDTGTILELMEIDPATIGTGPVTILRRGLSFYGDRTTETTALKLDWPSNSIVMLGTDVPQIFQYLKEYIDSASIAGAVPASTSAAGIVVEGTQAQVDARTPTTTILGVPYKNFAPLDKIRSSKLSDYAADAGATDAYAITVTPAITAYSTGQRFVFKANTANTGAATLNVSGVGAKTIKKAVSLDLSTGDIGASEIVEVIYDGTNFQLLNQKTDVQILTTAATKMGGITSQFDITNTSGTTYRYTWDGNGTDPGISAASLPVGTLVEVQTDSMTAGNRGVFTVTNSGTNYFEVTNHLGVAETNKTLTQSGFLAKSTTTWTRPAGATTVEVICIGAGGGGGPGEGGTAGTLRGGGQGGGGGALTQKIFRASDLSATVNVLIGVGGPGAVGGAGSSASTPGGASSFGEYIKAFGGGAGGTDSSGNPRCGGTGGGTGGIGKDGATTDQLGGVPASVVAVDGISGQGGGGALSVAGKNAEYGGGAGGGYDAGLTAYPGGSSLFGGAGGGGGAGTQGGSTPAVGAGGRHGFYVAGGGGVAGTSGTSPVAGSAGTSRSGYGCGDGGGGGGSNDTGTGAAGGAGGAPGGGGGGAGGGLTTGGSGGTGGAGEVRIISYF